MHQLKKQKKNLFENWQIWKTNGPIRQSWTLEAKTMSYGVKGEEPDLFEKWYGKVKDFLPPVFGFQPWLQNRLI